MELPSFLTGWFGNSEMPATFKDAVLKKMGDLDNSGNRFTSNQAIEWIFEQTNGDIDKVDEEMVRHANSLFPVSQGPRMKNGN